MDGIASEGDLVVLFWSNDGDAVELGVWVARAEYGDVAPVTQGTLQGYIFRLVRFAYIRFYIGLALLFS